LSSAHTVAPAFGSATLANCEREQIHLAGSIQPYGALLVVAPADFAILQASANAPQFLGLEATPVGRKLRDLGGDLWRLVGSRLTPDPDAIPVAVHCRLGQAEEGFNALLHHAPSGEIVIELERAGAPFDHSADIESALQGVIGATGLQGVCDEGARIFKRVTGYDRAMVYRFDEAGHGEVFSETKRPDLEAFFGNRYPASDIPQIARRLYERNRVRLIADVGYVPVPIEPRVAAPGGRELDMSLCFLRSASPIHIQYLKNMGVGATLVVSLMVGGKLWGLVSCHHYAPRYLHFEMRAVCELLGEILGTRIAALESFQQGQGELSVRRLEQRMIEGISREGDWRGALFDGARSLLLPLNAGGAALLFEGQVQTIGDVPGTDAIRDVARWIAPKLSRGVFSTASLTLDDPAFAALVGVASGVAATRISGDGEEMLIWFRPERVRTVTWGGDPTKPPSAGDDPSELSPRRSFAQWHQVVEGTSDPWTPPDLAAARMIGASVTDVIVQFRAVRILMAKDQLETVRAQVRASDQQVVVADANGRIIEGNAAFNALIGAGAPPDLDGLARQFADPEMMRRRLRALLENRQPWRAEAKLARGGDGRPVLVRADPVMATPDRALGFVLLFTDLTDKNAAEAARRRFQDGLLQSHRKLSGRIDTESDLAVQRLMSGVVENAQLAAMEITDGADPAEMPAMLESVRNSVARTAEVLEQLMLDARDGSKA